MDTHLIDGVQWIRGNVRVSRLGAWAGVLSALEAASHDRGNEWEEILIKRLHLELYEAFDAQPAIEDLGQRS